MFGALVSGVFTTARICDGCIVGAPEHRARLEEGARVLETEHGVSFALHLRSVFEAADFKQKSWPDGMARLAIGVDAEGHPGHFVEFAPARRKRGEIGDAPLVLTVAEDPRPRVDIKRFPRDDLTRIERDAQSQGVSGAVLTLGDALCEGTWFHVIGRVGDGFVTPPLGRAISGTTRSRVLRGLRGMGVPVAEQELTLQDLAALEGLYALSALIEVLPIRAIGGQAISMSQVLRDMPTLQRALSNGA